MSTDEYTPPSLEEQKELIAGNKDLASFTLDELDKDKLTPITPEVISRQATINIGTIGHVAHGKSTVVKSISGINPVKMAKEKLRNITIKLGYANAKIFKCPVCKPPGAYQPHGSDKPDVMPCGNEGCDAQLQLVRHISFVDCPGHDLLMATMLAGASVMDASLLLIAANESCPQPQTSEHLAAVEIMKLEHILILQNKVDTILSKEGEAEKQHKDIKNFVKGTRAENSPIIPVSAQLKYNMDAICDYICRIPMPIRDFQADPIMAVVRSFDINKPGCAIEDLKGGVVGGSLLKGVLRVGEKIEIRPGIIGRGPDGKQVSRPVISRIVSIRAEENDMLYAIPGGLIAVGLEVDPTQTKNDRLTGQILGHTNKLPDVINQVKIDYHLLNNLVGVKGEASQRKVQSLKKDEMLLINIAANTVHGKVIKSKKREATIEFTKPVCAGKGDNLTLSRYVNGTHRLIGWGEVNEGTLD